MAGDDVPAVIHVHTRYSDGRGRIPEIAAIAKRQGVRVVYITDHNTLQGRAHGEDGLYGGTLVLIGEELTSRDGHIVTLNVTQAIAQNQPADEALAAAAAQGGLTFLAHSYWDKEPWRDWSPTNFTGVELYNLAEDAYEENRVKLFFAAGPLPARLFFPLILDWPDRELEQWDRLTRQRRVVGIAGNDAHGLCWTPLVRLAPYDLAFACVRTHLVVPSLAPDTVHAALADGHAFIGFDLLADTTGFTFLLLHDHEPIAILGDERPVSDGLSLYIWTPRACTIRLLRDGQPFQEATGHECGVSVSQAGVYRVEADLDGHPWIISNPIYVREKP